MNFRETEIKQKRLLEKVIFLGRVLCFLQLFVFLSFHSGAATLEVHFIDVKDGDAILIRESGVNILIDGGFGYRWDWLSPDLFAFLGNKDIEKFDALIGTHPHYDHIGGLTAILNEYPVKKVYDSGRDRDWDALIHQTYLDLIKEKEVPFFTPRRGETIRVEHLKFKVLHPPEDVDEYSINNASLVLRLDYGDISFLFTGDIEKEAEKELVETDQELTADIIKVPHHGLPTSSTEKFIKKVDPEVAIIQNRIRDRLFPEANNVVGNLEKLGIAVYQNLFSGHISIYSDGVNYWMEVERDQVEGQ